jgi:hypothetical protein
MSIEISFTPMTLQNFMRRNSFNVSRTRRIILCFTVLIALTASADSSHSQSGGEREYVGTINNTLRIRIRLSQAGRDLSGSYIYEKIGKSLRLNGRMTYENEFYLDEFDEGGNQTGKFEGKFVSKDWIEGSWSSTSKKRSMPFSAWVLDGKQVPSAKANDAITGEYRRVDNRGRPDRDTSVLNAWLLNDGRVRIAGDSSWVGNAETGNVNVGSVDGTFELHGNKVFFGSRQGDEECRFTITFGAESLTVTEDNLKCGGLNVSFNGKYQKVRR